MRIPRCVRPNREELHKAWGIPTFGSIVIRRCGTKKENETYYATLQSRYERNKFICKYLGTCDKEGFPREKRIRGRKRLIIKETINAKI